MRTTVFLITLFVFISCIRDRGDSPPTTTTIINNSGHSIEYLIKVTTDTSLYQMLFIENNKEIKSNSGGTLGSGVKFFALSSDSVLVNYANKASIWHTKDINSPVSKSIVLESSYKVGDNLYEYTYIFTPQDYEEALEFGD